MASLLSTVGQTKEVEEVEAEETKGTKETKKTRKKKKKKKKKKKTPPTPAAPWTPEEHHQLENALKEFQSIPDKPSEKKLRPTRREKWRLIASKVPTRDASQCYTKYGEMRKASIEQIWIEEWQKRNGSPPLPSPFMGVKGDIGTYRLIIAAESERWPTKSEVCHSYSLCSGQNIFGGDQGDELRLTHCGDYLRDDEQIQANKRGYLHVISPHRNSYDPLGRFGPDLANGANNDDANSNASSSSSTETEAANGTDMFDRDFFFGKKTSHVGINCTLISQRNIATRKSDVNAIVRKVMFFGLKHHSGVLMDRFKKAVLIRLRDVGLYPVEYDDLDPIQRSTKINTYLEIMIEENVQYLEQNEFLEKITNEDDGQQYVNYVT